VPVLEPRAVIDTNEARCRDCYRCVRVCPVKAIRVVHGQASVDARRCLGCGTCVRECPQGAKRYRRDLPKAEALLKTRKFVAASLAPAFAGAFEPWALLRLPAALRRLGFHYVAETAVGAAWVAQASAGLARERKAPLICTACPAAVGYVEKYRPELVPRLLPLVSPMMAHARHVKARFGAEAGFVFIGSCVAKKAEAERPELAGLVDCVLTFEELADWLRDQGIDLGHCEESAFDEVPSGSARLFPVEGGSLATAGLASGPQDLGAAALSGFEALRDGLGMGQEGGVQLIEPLMCSHGCINGPGIRSEENIFDRRLRVLRFSQAPKSGPEAAATRADLSARYQACPPSPAMAFSEEQIRQVLEQTGKGRPENQLNCGACGYASCRDQVLAVLSGMAEREMCIPYMRRMAEQRSSLIMETSPNGIVILDRDLSILNANTAFEKLVHASSLSGQPISQYVDPDPFEQVASGQVALYDAPCRDEARGLSARLIAYPLPNEDRLAGIFVALPEPGEDARQLRRLKDETVLQARELQEQQVEMARQFANYLGQHTARGEQLVKKLIKAVESEAGPAEGSLGRP
jgi:iron only hydrogenase large subunit-like protein/PAS domain-containing protein